MIVLPINRKLLGVFYEYANTLLACSPNTLIYNKHILLQHQRNINLAIPRLLVDGDQQYFRSSITILEGVIRAKKTISR